MHTLKIYIPENKSADKLQAKYNLHPPSNSRKPNHQLKLASALGNSAFAGLIQARLKLGSSNDAYEKEADRIADMIIRVPTSDRLSEPRNKVTSGARVVPTRPLANQITPLVQRNLNNAEEESNREDSRLDEFALEQTRLSVPDNIETGNFNESDDNNNSNRVIQPKSTLTQSALIADDLSTQIETLAHGGQPLSTEEKLFFEPKFGVDFSDIRVHTGIKATQLADAIQVKAFTTGNHLVFNSGHYSPTTTSGRHLLAHELTHTIQQRSLAAKNPTQHRIDRSALSILQTTGRKQKKPVYPFGSLMWHYRKKPVTDRQIRRTLQYQYLRKRLGASHLDSIAACRLIHKDISKKDSSFWNLPVRYYLHQVRTQRNEKYDREMALYGWKPTSSHGITGTGPGSHGITGTGPRSHRHLINQRILPFTRLRRMAVEITPSGYITVGCKSSDGAFYRRFPLISIDGSKSFSLHLSRLDWSKTASSLITGHLKEESCGGNPNLATKQRGDTKRSTEKQCEHDWPDSVTWVSKVKLPLNWSALFGDTFEIRYHIVPNPKDDCVRRKLVLRFKGRVSPRPAPFPAEVVKGWKQWKGLKSKCEIRADPHSVTYNSCCPAGSEYAMQTSRKISMECVIGLSSVPHLSIKPQIAVDFWQDVPTGKIMGSITAFVRLVVDAKSFPLEGMTSEGRCKFADCKLADFEFNQNGIKLHWTPQCTSRYSECLSFIQRLSNLLKKGVKNIPKNLDRRMPGIQPGLLDQRLPIDRYQ